MKVQSSRRPDNRVWAGTHEDPQRLQNYGPDLAFGYSEIEEPREMRHPEAHEAAPDAA